MMARVRQAKDWIATVVLAVVLSGAIAGGFGAIVQSNQRADALARDLQQTSVEADERGQRLDEAMEAIGLLSDQVRTLGEVPVIDPPETPAPSDDDSSPVVVSAGRVQAAVRTVLAGDPNLPERDVQLAAIDWLEANPPADGEDGRAPTPEELAVQVAAYCATGACVGEQGQPGADGEDAPPVTDEQLAVVVASYCDVRGECRGPAGVDGKDGADSTVPGPPGPAGEPGAPGPACPAGYEPREVQVHLRVNRTDDWVDAILCLPDSFVPTPPTDDPSATPDP